MTDERTFNKENNLNFFLMKDEQNMKLKFFLFIYAQKERSELKHFYCLKE